MWTRNESGHLINLGYVKTIEIAEMTIEDERSICRYYQREGGEMWIRDESGHLINLDYVQSIEIAETSIENEWCVRLFFDLYEDAHIIFYGTEKECKAHLDHISERMHAITLNGD